ncbi:beta-glucosidase BglX [Pinibacter soli]|uniref:beta-glucosidase n=1 Tax=Pinibacter soli TaxID=3044211 RepID=A0ABT6R848_9BACT|nr:beta-glucosidase BglX [Pinibacter soli]MDI3318744.1 beta-glucosidase BglX [Pinibacter soli]
MKKLLMIGACSIAMHVSQGQTKTNTQDAKMNAFVNSLMQKMTVEEKIGQLNLVTPGGTVTGSVVSKDVDNKIRNGQVGSLFGITGPDKIRKAQEIAVNNSRLHIPLIFGLDVIHGHRTIFPIPLGLSCSWNMDMIEKSASIAASEATADGLSWVYSPMVDIARDPRWGRVSEGSGEDTYLGCKVATAMVKGYQGNGYSDPTKVMACVKHFALYGAAEAGRDYNTTDMSRIKMYEYYLPPYKAAVDAGVSSVMSSFNEVDGVPATANKWLMTDLLRKQWGFKGFVVTDYTAINEMIDHGLGDLQRVSAEALKAGIDMDMVGEGFLTTLQKSLKEGKVTIAQINEACKRVLEAKYKLGLFDDPYRYCNEQRFNSAILTDANRAAAREFATKSMVLLKNNNNVLPLQKGKTIALIGPLADNKRNMLGTWSVSGDPEKSIPVLQGLKNVAGNDANILYARGCNISDDTMFAKKVNAFGKEIEIDARSLQQMIDEAIATANKADVVVTVLGEAADMTGEASSMSDIGLQKSQKRLLEELKKTGKPIVIVLLNGRPMTLTWEDQNADAILDAWFSGTEAGNAIADVLFGNYNPSGKLTMSFPRNVGQIPIYYNHKNTGRPYSGVGTGKFRSNYLDVSNDPLYPFGYGLSYTSFTYSNVTLSSPAMKQDQKITASVTVTNSGKFDGTETVQLYIRDLVGTITRPVKELKGYQQVTLKAGESKKVDFTISVEDLKFYNSDLKRVAEPGDFKVFIGTNSRDVKDASFKLVQ